eukprot:TRINITY_DN6261_c0_g2_i1.p1 TRINITY_DN6261_c0_g2~~TRINITY_DN6261_c0_g2_i1.p1  ORF type:complete len:739 (-),score=185.19 TRINITY_DN6261_c0_g2_i1:155-2371(-)
MVALSKLPVAAAFLASTALVSYAVTEEDRVCAAGSTDASCPRLPESDGDAEAMKVSLLQTRRLKQETEEQEAVDADPETRKAALLQELESVESEMLRHKAADATAQMTRATSLKVRNLLEGTTGCHDIKEDEKDSVCWKNINWARNDGLSKNPEWYPGLTNTTPIARWQAFTFKNSHGQCPPPCSAHARSNLCKPVPAPTLWKPRMPKKTFDVKILSYNLFWWNLFRMRHGSHNSAARLIDENNFPYPFDVMGFQECESKNTLMHPLGLDKDFTSFDGNHAICQSFRHKAWKILDHGQADVAEDQWTEYYGTRGTVWMRLVHKESGVTLFFVNHHGPLSVNSGGMCGGESVAHNMLHLIKSKGREGDLIVVVGDFNANGASVTVQTLWKNLVLAYNGVSFGGVDNVFTNAPRSAVVETKDLGSGGSDHHAVSVTLELKGTEEASLIEAEYRSNATGSCASYGCSSSYVPGRTCQCTKSCGKYNNCCYDYGAKCETGSSEYSCKKYGCSTKWNIGHKCQCTASCKKHGDCCWDFHNTCELGNHQTATPAPTAVHAREQTPTPAPTPAPTTPHHEQAKEASCANYGCSEAYNKAHKCQCSSKCHKYHNCCSDYATKCMKPHRGRVVQEPLQSCKDSAKSECGLHETNVEYIYNNHVWHHNHDAVYSPRDCCRKCDQDHRCKTWVWYDWVESITNPRCVLQGGPPVDKKQNREGVTSGMPIHIAQQRAFSQMRHAISEMPN